MLSIQLAMNVNAIAGSPPLVPGAPLQLAAGLNFQVRPGDVIRGVLVLETGNKETKLNSKGLTLIFTGESISSVTTHSTDSKGHRHTHVYHGGGLLFTQCAALGLPQQSEHHFAANSARQFPFEFMVPFGSPPSQHHEFHDATATIRYDIKAVAHTSGLFSSNLKAVTSLVVLPVFPTQPMDGAAGLLPLERAGSLKVADICCCTCFGYKELRAIVRAPKSSLCVGEVLPLNIEVLNGLEVPTDLLTLSMQTHFIITVRGGPRSARRETTQWTKAEEVRVPPNAELAASQLRSGTGVQVASSVRSDMMVPDVNSSGFNSRSVIVAELRVRDSSKICRVELPLAAPYQGMMMPAAGVPMQMQMQMQPMQAQFAQPPPPPQQQQMQMVPLPPPQPQYPAQPAAAYPPYQQPSYGYAQPQQTVQQPMWQPPQPAAPASQTMQQQQQQQKEGAVTGAGTTGPPGGYNPPAWQPMQQPAYTPQPQQPQQQSQSGDRYQPAPAYDPAPAYAPAYNRAAFAPGGAPGGAPPAYSHAEGAAPPATS